MSSGLLYAIEKAFLIEKEIKNIKEGVLSATEVMQNFSENNKEMNSHNKLEFVNQVCKVLFEIFHEKVLFDKLEGKYIVNSSFGTILDEPLTSKVKKEYFQFLLKGGNIAPYFKIVGLLHDKEYIPVKLRLEQLISEGILKFQECFQKHEITYREWNNEKESYRYTSGD
jgi:hypothetical protein